jgi:hypothetical protein
MCFGSAFEKVYPGRISQNYSLFKTKKIILDHVFLPSRASLIQKESAFSEVFESSGKSTDSLNLMIFIKSFHIHKRV